MKKVIRAVSCYLVILLISVIIPGCCTNTYSIVGNGEMAAYVNYPNPRNLIDTVRGEFMLSVRFEQGMAGLGSSPVGLISSAYATTCADVFENVLAENSIKLYCNQPFLYDGISIPPGYNLINIQELTMNVSREFGAIDFYFSQSFLDQATFANGTNTFTVEATTSDGLSLTNQVSLTFAF